MSIRGSLRLSSRSLRRVIEGGVFETVLAWPDGKLSGHVFLYCSRGAVLTVASGSPKTNHCNQEVKKPYPVFTLYIP